MNYLFSMAYKWQTDCTRGAVVLSRLKVLIVEDDNAMAQMCAKLVRRHGHSAVIARSGVDALAIVRAGGDVDAVISDIQMPQMSGTELLARLHEMKADLPVILMTGYATVVGADEAVSLGATDYISKPFNAETLVGSLERALRRPGRTECSAESAAAAANVPATAGL
jgi:DNA-binding NtrC family response regulator